MSSGAGPDALRWLREISGLTQRGLAERAGVSERTIRGLETGQVRTPHQASLRALVDAAGLNDIQAAALLRAWEPGRVRSLAELARGSASFEDVVAETILQAEVEEHLVASWTRFLVRDGQPRAIESDLVVEAQRDGVDTYVIPYVHDTHGPEPQVETTASNCRVRERHHFAEPGLSVFELELPLPLAIGESTAFSFGMTLTADTSSKAETDWTLRLVHRTVPLTVIEVIFEGELPPQVWEVDGGFRAERRRVRAVVPSPERRVQLIKRNARPGSYGFEWEVPQHPR